jgi:murein peptide amidase A
MSHTSTTSLEDAVAATGLAVIGTSRQGRPIHGGPVGGGKRAPGQARPLLLVGGVHGDEPASVQALLDLVGRHRGSGAPGGDRPLWVLPSLNPDGLAAGRKNAASDVDLNRNFPARSFSRDHRPGYDPGPHPLSEPETALLARVLAGEPFAGVVAVHAPFACVNYDGPARAWAQAVAAACGWPVRESIGYPTPGSLGSWLGTDRGLPILTLELPPGPWDTFAGAGRAALDAAAVFGPDGGGQGGGDGGDKEG